MNNSIYLYLLLLLFLNSCQQKAAYNVKLSECYSSHTITLPPPLKQYKELRFYVDSELIAETGFNGVRVDINVPHNSLRNYGDHPAAVTYFYTNSKSILVAYDRDGIESSRRVIHSQWRIHVEEDKRYIFGMAKKSRIKKLVH